MQKRKRTNSRSAQKRGKSSILISFFKPNKFSLGSSIQQKAFLALGLVLISAGLLLKLQAQQTLSFDGSFGSTPAIHKDAKPTVIEIPSIKQTLTISPARIINNKWEVDNDSVNYLVSSVQPGEKGNTILYGHNSKNVLKGLHDVKIGETMTITNESGEKFTYKIYSVKIVNPNQIDALTEFKNQTVSIYTCTGFADSKRLLVKAERVDNTPITL